MTQPVPATLNPTNTRRAEEFRFTGRRFDTLGLPVEVLPEFGRYRDLVLEVAKALYFEDNPARSRLPNRFEEGLRLRLSAIQSGSVRSIMEREASASDPSLVDPADDYYDRAKDFIFRTIQTSNNGAEPDRLPSLGDYSYDGFLQFGSTLEDDEAIQFTSKSHSGKGATLDRSARMRLRTLVTSSTPMNARMTRLVGCVTAVDAAQERFTLWLHDERRPCSGPYDSDIHLEFLRKHLTPGPESGPTVAIIGHINFDSKHNPTNWDWMYSIASLDGEDGYERLARQLREVERAPKSYLQVSAVALEAARTLHKTFSTAGVPAPTAFPTPEGGVDFEWSFNGVEASLQIASSGDQITLSHWDEELDTDSYREDVPTEKPEVLADWVRTSLRIPTS